MLPAEQKHPGMTSNMLFSGILYGLVICKTHNAKVIWHLENACPRVMMALLLFVHSGCYVAESLAAVVFMVADSDDCGDGPDSHAAALNGNHQQQHHLRRHHHNPRKRGNHDGRSKLR